MGVTYAAIDRFLLTGEGEEADLAIIDRFHKRSGISAPAQPPIRDKIDEHRPGGRCFSALDTDSNVFCRSDHWSP